MTEALNTSVRLRGRLQELAGRQGPEFAGRIRDRWAYRNGVEIDVSPPGKPTDTVYVA